jgi:hypothetical protein
VEGQESLVITRFDVSSLMAVEHYNKDDDFLFMVLEN